MNILQIESATNFSGGVNQMLLNSIELQKRGHRIYAACVKDSPIYKILHGKGFDIVEIDENKKYRSAKIVRNFLKNNRIDIIHTHHSKGHMIGLLSVIGRKKERLVVQRSVIFPTVNIFKYWNPRVDKFIANSRAVKDVMKHYHIKESKIKIIYSAVDKNQFIDFDRDSIREEFNLCGKFVFGIVGNYSDYKGHDILLEAFGKIKDKNILLIMIGKDTEKLVKKTQQLKIDDKVRILGFRKDARKIMKGLDCLVIPSLKESFSNVVIEAFFMKVPVVGTNVGGIPELLEDKRGILCEPDADSIKGSLIEALNSDLKQITDSAYEFADNYLTIEKKIDGLEAVYKELI